MHQYPSDISREEYKLIREDLEGAKKTTRPRKYDLYDVFCAVLYVIQGGIQWRMLPSDYPKWQSVYYHFRVWSEKDETGVSILHTLRVNDSKGGLIPPQVFVPYPLDQFMQNFVKNTDARFILFAPYPEIVVNTLPLGIIAGQHPPLNSTLHHIQHRTKHVVQIVLSWARLFPRSFQILSYLLVFFPIDVAWILMHPNLISRLVFPYYCSRKTI